MNTHTYTCGVERPPSGIIAQALFTFFPETESIPGSPIHLDCLQKPQGSACASRPPSTGKASMHSFAWIFTWVWGSKPGRHACVASTLSPGLPPQPVVAVVKLSLSLLYTLYYHKHVYRKTDCRHRRECWLLSSVYRGLRTCSYPVLPSVCLPAPQCHRLKPRSKPFCSMVLGLT